ncbi:MAG: hypothetical protein HRT87_06600 [Legionellales bacterium]|nr:hypothetical protein [Legionellales bacterium]
MLLISGNIFAARVDYLIFNDNKHFLLVIGLTEFSVRGKIAFVPPKSSYKVSINLSRSMQLTTRKLLKIGMPSYMTEDNSDNFYLKPDMLIVYFSLERKKDLSISKHGKYTQLKSYCTNFTTDTKQLFVLYVYVNSNGLISVTDKNQEQKFRGQLIEPPLLMINPELETELLAKKSDDYYYKQTPYQKCLGLCKWFYSYWTSNEH